MTKITFVVNSEAIEVDARNGLSLLEVARENNIEIEGACGGSLACSTCHVIVDKHFDLLPEASEDEEDMLDLAFGVKPTSRLGCQVLVSSDLDGAIFTVAQSKHIKLST